MLPNTFWFVLKHWQISVHGQRNVTFLYKCCEYWQRHVHGLCNVTFSDMCSGVWNILWMVNIPSHFLICVLPLTHSNINDFKLTHGFDSVIFGYVFMSCEWSIFRHIFSYVYCHWPIQTLTTLKTHGFVTFSKMSSGIGRFNWILKHRETLGGQLYAFCRLMCPAFFFKLRILSNKTWDQ